MGNIICTSDAEASSLESMVLELEYLYDHAPEAGAKRVLLLRQEAGYATASAPLKVSVPV